MPLKLDITVPDSLQQVGIGTNIDLSKTPYTCLEGIPDVPRWDDLPIETRGDLLDFFVKLREVKYRMLKEEGKQFIIETGKRIKSSKTEADFLEIMKALETGHTIIRETMMFRAEDGNFEISFDDKSYQVIIGVRPRRAEQFDQPMEYMVVYYLKD